MLGEVSFMLFAYEMSMLCTDGKVTDLASYYTLPSTIIGNPQYDTLKAAFMYYTVAARTPLQQLMQDLLVLAHQKCASDVLSIKPCLMPKPGMPSWIYFRGDWLPSLCPCPCSLRAAKHPAEHRGRQPLVIQLAPIKSEDLDLLNQLPMSFWPSAQLHKADQIFSRKKCDSVDYEPRCLDAS